MNTLKSAKATVFAPRRAPVTLALLCSMVLASNALAASVNFQQIDWGDGLAGFNALNSDWGRAEVALSPADTALLFADGLGGSYGYLNIVTDTSGSGGTSGNWAVQNVPLTYANTLQLEGLIPDGYMFDLGVASGVDVASLSFAASIDANPISSPITMGAPFAMGGATVDAANHVMGGLTDLSDPLVFGGTERNPPPKAMNTAGAASGEMIHSSGKIKGKESDVPAINEDVNGCAPGSAARSIHYLGRQFSGLAMALGTETPQQTYEKLKMQMGTQVGKNGSGTTVPNFKVGKDRYDAALPGAEIMTTQTGRSAMDFMDAMNGLINCKDIEAMIYWGTDAAGKSMGGHAAFVSEITKIKDATTGAITGYKVNIIDDRPQGDGTANNTKTTLTFDAAGNLKGYGTGAQLIGFQIEMFVPEPAALALTLLGACGMLADGRRRTRGARSMR